MFRGTLSAVECTFELNEVENNGEGQTSGGAIVTSDADVDLDNCSFKGNKAGGGGGLRMFRGTLIALQCTFELNEAGSSGGAIRATDANVDLDKCSFKENKADIGGALRMVRGTLIALECTFELNEVGSSGGAIYASGTDAGDTNTNLIGCSFSGNLDSAQAPSDLWYDSETTTVNVFSTCAEGYFTEGEGVLACYESDGTSVIPCDPALPANPSGKCEKCGKGSFSCCGATECTDSEPICNEVFHELTCPSSEDNNDKRYSKKGHLRAIEPPSVFAGNTRAS